MKDLKIKEDWERESQKDSVYLQETLHELELDIQKELHKKKPAQIMLSEPFDFNDKVIIVVDDVSNSGKTMLYALKPFLDSHPKKIQTLVLVERTHKAFPVLSDYVGLSVATTLQEHIIVEVSGDHVTGAYLE